ncbi:hypothetical protein BGX29_002856, partial [Mortierella sp. GBA35]
DSFQGRPDNRRRHSQQRCRSRNGHGQTNDTSQVNHTDKGSDGRTFEYAEDGGKPITRKILERQQDNFSQKRSIPRVRGRLQQFL